MPDDSSALDQAQRRLEAALRRLEAGAHRVAAASTPEADPRAEEERRSLQIALQEARSRERQLELVAAEASAALGRAAAEVRAALEAEG